MTKIGPYIIIKAVDYPALDKAPAIAQAERK